MAALTYGCSASNKTCGPATCEGCCDSSGACQFGNTALACGGSGGSCRSCQSAEVCTGGLCLLPTTGGMDAGGGTGSALCNENNCPGCCNGDTCVAGKAVTACGQSGVACATCTGNQQCTTGGRCQNAACTGCIDSAGSCQTGQSTSACGAQGYSCLACTAGATCNSAGLCVGGSCDGCRDGQGVCRGGTSKSACGNSGNSCAACGSTELCNSNGVCVAMPKPDAGPGSCNATTCPDGCCSGSSCITRTTTSQCGKGGNECAPCGSRQTCESGTCKSCSGCVDVSTGLCTSGTTNSSCGKSGNYCQTCDTSSGQACTNSVCQGGGCNASTCPTGCCDGLTCVRPADYTNFRCGSGTTGGACIACNGSCDPIQGVCVSTKPDAGSGGAVDGGGFGKACSATDASACAVGECCIDLLGAYNCFASGTDLFFFKICGSKTACAKCSGTTMCDLQTYTCQ